MKPSFTLPALGGDLLLAPVRGWLPLVLPLAALLAAVCVLCLFSGQTADAAGVPATPAMPDDSRASAEPQAGLLEQALTASGLRELDDLEPLIGAGAWLALPGGPYLARLLDPELRLMLGLRGKLSNGGPFLLPDQGALLLQQASPAAEDLLRRCQPAAGVEFSG
jgi:hypothetical protein